MKNCLRFYIYTLLTLIAIGNITVASAYSDDEIFEEQTIAVSPSGELLAAYWFDSISIYNLQSGEKIHQFKTKTTTPFVLTFSPDNSKLMSSGWEKLAVWDLTKGKLKQRINTVDNVDCGGFSNNEENMYYDDEYNAFGQRQLVLTGSSLKKDKRTIKSTARCNASADQTLLAMQIYNLANDFTLDSSDIEVINLNTMKTENVLKGEEANGYDEDMFFFDNNKKLLVRDFSDFHLWDLENNSVIRSWDSELDLDHAIVSNNRLLMVDDQQVRVWDLLAEPSPIGSITLPENHENVISANLSNNGQLFSTTSYSEVDEQIIVSIFKTGSNEIQHQIEVSGFAYGGEFTNDDSLLVINSYPILVVDVATGEVKQKFTVPSEYQ